MDLYVGNLAYGVTESDLEKTFSTYGKVSKAKVIMDRDTGRSKGFGFVTMDDEQEAKEAMNGLNGSNLQERPLKVNESEKRESGGGSKRPFNNNSRFQRDRF